MRVLIVEDEPYLAEAVRLAGASAGVLRPLSRLLNLASVVTLALNVADLLVAGEYGKAAFDVVGHSS